eukprot:gnl/MRDRNA2_/MRDRNA2_69443_c0_seq2.p1 gnl/MRDRNA2_/MRDRNA2_69443_c0~~gnl/MRDRNA2_/MRDRNA2_69443_c0_seq2.p1  ORF type:complete len:2288 (-),score=467.47 gnl/MRDRNA2_/MRDRNA2_69443_c0_seq2:215-6241(-)
MTTPRARPQSATEDSRALYLDWTLEFVRRAAENLPSTVDSATRSESLDLQADNHSPKSVACRTEESFGSSRSAKPGISDDARMAIGLWFGDAQTGDLSGLEGLRQQPPLGCEADPRSSATSTTRASHSPEISNEDASSPVKDASSPDKEADVTRNEAERQLFMSGDDLSDLSSESTGTYNAESVLKSQRSDAESALKSHRSDVESVVRSQRSDAEPALKGYNSDAESLLNSHPSAALKSHRSDADSVPRSHRSDASIDTLLMISEASSARSGSSMVTDLARNFVRDCVDRQLANEAPMDTTPMTNDPLRISGSLCAPSQEVSTSRRTSCEQDADVLPPPNNHEDEGACSKSTPLSSRSSPGWAAAMAESILHSSNSKPLAELSAAWARHMVDQVGQMLNGDDAALGDCPQLALDFAIPESARSAVSAYSRPGTAKADNNSMLEAAQAEDCRMMNQESMAADKSRPATPADNEQITVDVSPSESRPATAVSLHVVDEPLCLEPDVQGALENETAECLVTGPSTTRSNICCESNEDEEADVAAEDSLHCLSECLDANPKSSRSVTYATENVDTELHNSSGLQAEHLAGETPKENETPRSPSQCTTVSFALQPETSRSVRISTEQCEVESPTPSNAQELNEDLVASHEDLIAEPPTSRSTRCLTECPVSEARSNAGAMCESDFPETQPPICSSIHATPERLVTQPPTSRSICTSPERFSYQAPTSPSAHRTPETSEERLATQPPTSRSTRDCTNPRSGQEEMADEVCNNDSATSKVSQLFKEMCKTEGCEESMDSTMKSCEKELSSEECRSILANELAKLNDMASGLEDVALGLDVTAEKLSTLNTLVQGKEEQEQPENSKEDEIPDVKEEEEQPEKIKEEISEVWHAPETQYPLKAAPNGVEASSMTMRFEAGEAVATKTESKIDEKVASRIPVFEAESSDVPTPLNENIGSTPPTVKFEIIVPETPKQAGSNVEKPNLMAEAKSDASSSLSSSAADIPQACNNSRPSKRAIPQRRCEAIDLNEEAGEAAQWGSLKFSQESQRTKKPLSSLAASNATQPCLTLGNVLASAGSMRPPSRSGKDSSVDPVAELRSIAKSSGNASVSEVLERLLPHVTNQLRDVLSEAVKQSIAKELEQYTSQLDNCHSSAKATSAALNEDESPDSADTHDPVKGDHAWRWGRLVTACMAREAEKLRQSEERETLQRALREATDQNKFTQRDGRLQNVLFASQASWHRQQRFELLQEIEHVQMAWEDERAHMTREMERTMNGTVPMYGLHCGEASATSPDKSNAVTMRLGNLQSVAHPPDHATAEAECVHDKWAAMAWPTGDADTLPTECGADEMANAGNDFLNLPSSAHQDSLGDAAVGSDDEGSITRSNVVTDEDKVAPEAQQGSITNCDLEIDEDEVVHEAQQGSLTNRGAESEDESPEASQQSAFEDPHHHESIAPESYVFEDSQHDEVNAREASEQNVSEDPQHHEVQAVDVNFQESMPQLNSEVTQGLAAETIMDQPCSVGSSRSNSKSNSPSKDEACSKRSSRSGSKRSSPSKKDLQYMPRSPCTKALIAASPTSKGASQEEGQADPLPFYTPTPKAETRKTITLKSMCERSNDLLAKKREEMDTIKREMKARLSEGMNDVHRALDRKLSATQADLWRLEHEHTKLKEEMAWQSQVDSESECTQSPACKTPVNRHPPLADLAANGDGQTPMSSRTPVEELDFAEQSPALSARSAQSVHTDSEDEQASSAATTTRDHDQASSAASTTRDHDYASSAASSSRDVNTLEQKAIELVEQRESEIRRLQDQILKNESLDAHKLDTKDVAYNLCQRPSVSYDKPQLSYKSQNALPLGDLRRQLGTQHALRVRDLPKRAVGGSYPIVERNDFQMAQPMPPKPARCSPKEPSEFPSLKRCGSQPKTSGNAVRMLPPQPTFALQGGDPRAMQTYDFDDRQSGRSGESGRGKKNQKRMSARDVKHRSKLDVLGSMYAPLLAPAEATRHHIQKVQSLPSLRPAGCIY